jgi:rhodanese-related sulfurtransferase
MNAPFYKFGLFGDEASFIIAFLIGIGFGFFLERAGFGSSRKLAAQFYFRDLSVLKVMFTAIITAMTGLYFFARLGIVDLSLVYLVPTFLIPQIAGGLLLGVGFVIGGYCPGTSCVSAATGRIDGIVYLVGMVAGLLGFAEVYPHIAPLTQITSLGQITLPKLFNVPYGVLVFAVVLMAVGAFAAGEWAEKKFGGKEPDPKGSLIGSSRTITPVRALTLGLAAVGLFAAFAGDPYRGSHATVDTKDLALRVSKGADVISPGQLADWIIQGRSDFRLIDLRSEKDYATYHVPTAENVPLASLTPGFAGHNEKLILFAEDGAESAKAWYLLEAQGFRSVYVLDGGLQMWRTTVLFPRRTSDMTQSAFERRVQVAKFFGGAAQTNSAAVMPAEIVMPNPATPVASPTAAPVISKTQPRKKKEGC